MSVARILNRVGLFVRRHARDRWMASESIYRMCRPTETSHRLLTDWRKGEPHEFITLDLRIQCEIFVSFVEPIGANHEGHFERFSARRKKQGCLLIHAIRGLCHTGKNETNYSNCTLEMLALKCKFNYIHQTETVGSAQSVNTDVNAEISLTGNIQRLAVPACKSHTVRGVMWTV